MKPYSSAKSKVWCNLMHN